MTPQESNDSSKAEQTGGEEEEKASPQEGEASSMEVPPPAGDPASSGSVEDESFGDTEDVEPESLNARFILRIGGISTAVLAFIVVLLIQVINLQQRAQELTVAEQAAYVDQRTLERQAREQLQSYGPVGEGDTVYHIPIDEAIDYVVRERYGGQDTSE
jgi:hypothetical protein